MNWTEQTQQMMRSWTQTQRKLWEAWGGGLTGKPTDGGSPWSAWMSQWHSMARESMRRMTTGTAGVPKEVAERLFVGESAFLRFVDLTVDAMKTVAPKIDAGEDWPELLRRYLAQVKEELAQPSVAWPSPERAAEALRDVPELWKLYVGQLRELGLPWAQSLREARGHLGEAMSGDRHAAIKMSNLFLDTFENTLGKFTAAPAIGYTREFQEKVTKAFETWVDVRRAEMEFQTELLNTGIRALEELVRELVERAERGEKVKSYRELFDLWVATAEKAYFEIASTDSFAEIQARLVNAAMHYRVHEREVAEEFLKTLHLPTRRELDDAYRHMHELRREVKVLKREMAQLKDAAPVQEPPTPQAKSPARRARARKAVEPAEAPALTQAPEKAPDAQTKPESQTEKEG
ncbi:MAG: hypothetical protein Kow0092_09150 [Deferrisomatales bacterium]